MIYRTMMVAVLAMAGPASAQDTKALDPASRIDRAFGSRQSQSAKPDLAFGAYQRGEYLTAFRLALPRAEAGDTAAQTLIAELYNQGRGVEKDTVKAGRWYEVAANGGNREAQFSFGLKLLHGNDVPKDVNRGIELMTQAAKAGHPLAMFNYASYLVSERPTTAGYRKALPYFEKAAEYRLADAYYALAKIYGQGLATGIGDPDRAREWLVRAAKAGIDTAQVELGIAFANGNNVEKDMKKAHDWLRMAARSGNVIAQNRLAHMLFLGEGIEPAPVEAGMWYLLSSRAGRADLILDEAFRKLDDKSRAEALSRANRWPS